MSLRTSQSMRVIRHAIAALAVALPVSAWAHGSAPHDHAAHAAAARTAAEEVKRSTVEVSLPALRLVREDGVALDLREIIGSGEPVFVNFIFTSCTTVCPVMSETFARLAEDTSRAQKRPRLVSISLDPEVDTPERLRTYAQQFGAPSQWHFFTGTNAASTAAQKAFGLNIPDKMGHPVAAFYYPGKGKDWVRLEGFASPEELAALLPVGKPHQHHH